ncbi:MAG: T9SS type A sorting domain-containing protein [Bacteroidales bacterium]|jgi:hypothetical protein|nr:T9SS type A sorting domain-containing protein [Bacteroidales bacterium]
MKLLYLWLWLIVLLPAALTAQNTQVKFDYDAAGNRTDRWLVPVKLKNSDSLLADPALYSLMADISDEASLSENSRETQVYPNPVERLLSVMPGSDADVVCRYRLLDTHGRLLLDEQTDQYPFTINMQQWQAGTYYLHLQSGTLSQLFKLIKK